MSGEIENFSKCQLRGSGRRLICEIGEILEVSPPREWETVELRDWEILEVSTPRELEKDELRDWEFLEVSTPRERETVELRD